MLTLHLEPTDDRANPLFKDVQNCAVWLKQLQLTNLQVAHSLLMTQVNEYSNFATSGLERLLTLELLRDTIYHVQNDYAKKLVAKPLPLNENELIIFVSIVQLWQAMTRGYRRCLQDYMAGDRHLIHQGALLCQRCLLYNGLVISEYLRTGYEFDSKLWQLQHKLYGFAEERDLQFVSVPDPLNAGLPASNCHGIYIKILLTCFAYPAKLTRSQLPMVDIWLTKWSDKISVDRSYTTNEGEAQPLALDLADKLGLRPVKLVAHSDSMRYLTMAPLCRLIRDKIILLQQGQTPLQANLDVQSSARECIELLTFLHQTWCEDSCARFVARNPGSQNTQLCCKSESIFAHLTGKTFKQSMQSAAATAMALKQIETYGRVLQEAPNRERIEAEFPLEIWSLENETSLGAKLIRADMQGARLSPNQLIALRHAGTEIFILGVSIWVNVARDGHLRIGMRYLHGTIQAIGLRMVDMNLPISGQTAPGFLLLAVPALKTPSSLIIPPNWFQAGRVVEITHQNGEKHKAKMGFSVERGLDYERVSFSLMRPAF